LDSANFVGGTMTLDVEKARTAVGALGQRFGLSTEAMAQGIIDIINAKMADAIRTITIRRGIDPRDFSLVAYGGAGPAQAAALAEQLEIPEVIVPVMPGAFSAWGMLQTDIRHDFKMTYYEYWERVDRDGLEEKFAKLEAEGGVYLRKQGVKAEDIAFERLADFRYHGQEYVLTIPIPIGPIDMHGVRRSFDAAYDLQYGHSSPDYRVEVTNLRVAALGRLKRPGAAEPAAAEPRQKRRRSVYFGGRPHDTTIIDRAGIAPGEIVRGPAIIEEPTATTLVPDNWQVETIAGGHMALTRKA
jgi:N-methylhydantoinase A